VSDEDHSSTELRESLEDLRDYLADEIPPLLVADDLWTHVKSGAMAAACEEALPADAYRVRTLLAHWLAEGAVTATHPTDPAPHPAPWPEPPRTPPG
jgi:hypothetical protein